MLESVNGWTLVSRERSGLAEMSGSRMFEMPYRRVPDQFATASTASKDSEVCLAVLAEMIPLWVEADFD